MRIPSEHFSNIPVFALSPPKPEEEQEEETKMDRRALRKHQRDSLGFFKANSASSSNRSSRESTPTEVHQSEKVMNETS